MDPSTLPEPERSEDWQDWSKDGNLLKRVTGSPLAGEQLTERLVGSSILGCYTNGERFSERLTREGKVVLPEENRTVAEYAIQGDNLCFAYPEQQPACYTVTETSGGLLFYTAGGYRLVASTDCPIPQGTRGLQQGSG